MPDNQNNIPEQNDSNIEAPEIQENTNTDQTSPATEENINTAPIEEATLEEATVEEAPLNEAPEEASAEEAPEEAPEEEIPAEENEPSKFAYEWNYTTLTPAPKPRKKKTGLIFGLIMGGVILISILALIATIIVGMIMGTFDLGNFNVDYNTIINGSDNGPTVSDSVDASTESIESFKHSTVVVLCDNSTGTGIILSENGMIVTNHHVIEDATTINVYLYDGRSYSATLIGSDAYNDVAVIKINAPNLIPAVFANSEEVYTGDRVYAVGTPAGVDFAWSVTAGIVSHPYRELKFYTDDGLLERSLFLIQTDALVNPGNSGGPLVNNRCEVIGIVTMRLTDEYVGMGFAVPTNTALPIIQSIIEDYVDTPAIPSNSPQLGIMGIVVAKGEKFTMSDMGFKDIVTDEFYERHPERCYYASQAGVFVISVTEGVDAYGKLQPGDIIIKAGKTNILSMNDLKNAITSKKVGDTLALTVIRNGSQVNVSVTLGRATQ